MAAVDQKPVNKDVMQQAQYIWKMLEELSSTDPQAYKKFIEKNMNEAKEQMAPPTPHMCVQTSLVSPRKEVLYINFCAWSKVPDAKSDDDPIPVMGIEIQNFKEKNTGTASLTYVAFSPDVLNQYGKDCKMPQYQQMLINLAIDFVEAQNKCKVSRNYTLLKDKTHIGGSKRLLKSFRQRTEQGNKEFENHLDDLQQTFGPLQGFDAKESLMKQLGNLSTSPENDSEDEDSDNEINDVNKIGPAKESFLKGLSSTPDIKMPSDMLKSVNNGSKKLIEEINTTNPAHIALSANQTIQIPEFSLTDQRLTGEGDNVLITVQLPGVTTVNDCELDISEDEVSLLVPEKYELTIELPSRINDTEARAKFLKKSATLVITLPHIAS